MFQKKKKGRNLDIDMYKGTIIWGHREKMVFYKPRKEACSRAFPHVPQKDLMVAQLVRNLPVMQEIWVWSLGQEDPLEKGMTTHFSILA